MILSFLHLITWFSFRSLVFLFFLYRFIIQCYRKYFHKSNLKNHDHDGKSASNETILWNKLIRVGLKINHKSVEKFRQASRRQVPILYPKLEDYWFGCAEKVEKIEKLRDSHWITMKNSGDCKKVMLFIHGGGFISGSSLGMDAQSTLYGIKDFNKKGNGNSISHVLSVEYRLAEDPKFYETMDKRTLTSNLNDQLEDCFDCFKYLINEKKVMAKDIVIAGFSAGACHSAMLVLDKLMNSPEEEGMWPVHSIALFSAPCDLSNVVIKADRWREENVLILNQGLVDLINRCVSVEEKKNYSILKKILEMEKQDESFYERLLQTKWVINYSNHEELTPGNEYLSHLLETKSQQVNPKQVSIVTENHQMHCYPIAQCLLSEGKKSMEQVLFEAINI